MHILPLLSIGLVLLIAGSTASSKAAASDEDDDKGHVNSVTAATGQSTGSMADFHNSQTVLSVESHPSESPRDLANQNVENDYEGHDKGHPLMPSHSKEHKLEKRDLNERIRQHMMEQQQQHRAVNYTGCDTCRKMHLDMKQASLDHIKKYVLSFLGFNVSGPPKKPGAWPSVPDYIWEQYYAAQSGGSLSPGDEWEDERVSHQHQQRYMDMHASGATTDQDFMADDPNWILRQQEQHPQQQDEEPFTPVVKTNRIYLFANVTKFRHQQHDLMSFEFPATMSKRKKNHGKNGEVHDSLNPLMYLDVNKALLHISFCNEHVNNAALMDDLRDHFTREVPFRVTLHRLITKDHQGVGSGAADKFSKEEVTVEVPERLLEALFVDDVDAQLNNSSSSGGRRCRKRIQLDVSQMVKDWYKYPKRNHGLLLTTQPVRLKNLISMKQTEHKPFLELWTEPTRKKRVKRDLSMSCKEGDFERRCCMYPLKVDFEMFGWDFIIAPKQYEANYCAGECAINFLPAYTHTHMMQMSTSAPACCSPKKMQPLSLLYFNRKEQVIYTRMENMVVETCGCA